jgi:hypothetical protein
MPWTFHGFTVFFFVRFIQFFLRKGFVCQFKNILYKVLALALQSDVNQFTATALVSFS